MEKARVRQRRQQFQTRLEARTSELRETLAAQLANGSTGSKNAWMQTRPVFKLQYEIGELCAEYDELTLAIVYFQQLLTGVEEFQSTTNQLSEDIKEATALRHNALNQLAAMHFRTGKEKEAMEFLQQVKKHEGETCEPIDKAMMINYALMLHAKGDVAAAEKAAESVIKVVVSSNQEVEEEDGIHARCTAFMLLASINKAKGAGERATDYADRAVVLAERVQDPRLISRSHNNLGIYCLERNDVERAFTLFLSAYRATQQTKDFAQQAVVRYHLGLTIAYLGRTLIGKELGDEDDEEEEHSLEPRSAEITETATPPAKTPKDLFLGSEKLNGALPDPDQALRVLAHCCRGEEEYYAGEFHTAEAEFAIALGQLNEFAQDELDDQIADPVKSTGDEVPELEPTLPPINYELAKLQGLLLSYTGCTQLVEGKFGLAERSHKHDLALALRQEDLYAQHRALRNLAIAFNATQRYIEAIPMWREALEIAAVLGLKTEQLMAYSGLGSAVRELLMLEGPKALETAGLDLDSPLMQPLEIFQKQRVLAQEAGDLHQQILAQRHIVSVFESPICKPQSDQEATEALEQRLAECDDLVNLCERYQNLQYRADAYRSLANALTSQIARLKARVSGDGNSTAHYGLTAAIEVLTDKRNSVCDSYQQATLELSTTAVVMFHDVQEDDDLHVPTEERHPRPPLTRLEILQRR